MRGAFIWMLITLLAGVGLVALLETDPGYVLISYGLTTIETSLWVGLILLVLVNVLMFLTWRFLISLMATRSAVQGWLSVKAYSRELVQLEMKLADGGYIEVADTLSQQGPGKLNVQELRLLARAHRGLHDWPALVKLLPWLRKRRVLDADEQQQLEYDTWTGTLDAAADDQLKQAWAGLPGEQRKDAALVEHYGKLLIASGDDLEAEKLLTRAIKREWDGRLVAQYGRIRGRDPARRLKQAEKWLANHQEDASLMLCLGRLSLRNDLWGKARDYFESSHRLQPSAEACAELARLLFSLGEREKSAQYYREGLMLRENNLPDLPLPKKNQSGNFR